jgi:hypothetical protein
MGLSAFSKEDGLKQLDHEPSRLKDQDEFSSLLLVLLIFSGGITSNRFSGSETGALEALCTGLPSW